MAISPFLAPRTMLAIMSYNRGESLRNCLRSVERHMPGFESVVFDDHSTNRPTRRVLEELSRRHQIVDCKADAQGDRGGLHANMNRALRMATERGFDFIFFVQDDMQVVRDVDQDFADNVNAIFNSDETIAQVGALFYRGYWSTNVLRSRVAIDRQLGCYQHQAVSGWNNGIVDCGIISLERINAKGFRFAESEADSVRRAQSLALRRADARDPIMMFTPWPDTTPRMFAESLSLKKAIRRILIKVQELAAGAGCHPFLPMSRQAIESLKSRPLDEFPVAENYLLTERNLLRPWWYSACNDLSDFKSLKTLLSLRWFTSGPANYRANVRLQQEQDQDATRQLSVAGS